MMRLAFSLGSELPLHANPTVGGTKPHRSDTGKTWLWRCLAILAVLGLPWCVHAKPEAESSAHVDERLQQVARWAIAAGQLTRIAQEMWVGELSRSLPPIASEIEKQAGREQAQQVARSMDIELYQISASVKKIIGSSAQREAHLMRALAAIDPSTRDSLMTCVASMGAPPVLANELQEVATTPFNSNQGIQQRLALIDKYLPVAAPLNAAPCMTGPVRETFERLVRGDADDEVAREDANIRRAMSFVQDTLKHYFK